jgi:hypothetical protein
VWRTQGTQPGGSADRQGTPDESEPQAVAFSSRQLPDSFRLSRTDARSLSLERLAELWKVLHWTIHLTFFFLLREPTPLLCVMCSPRLTEMQVFPNESACQKWGTCKVHLSGRAPAVRWHAVMSSCR